MDRRADLACQWIDVDQAADGDLEAEREWSQWTGQSRAILTAQKHGQLDKRRLRLNVDGTSPCNMEVLQYNPEILIEYGLQTLNECKSERSVKMAIRRALIAPSSQLLFAKYLH